MVRVRSVRNVVTFGDSLADGGRVNALCHHMPNTSHLGSRPGVSANEGAEADTGKYMPLAPRTLVKGEPRERISGAGSYADSLEEIERLRMEIQARDQALAVAAHDLRNPLNVITLAASTLGPMIPDGPTRLQLDRLTRAAHRADRLVHDLLDVSAVETGCFTVYPTQTEIADLLLAMLDSQQALAAEAEIALMTDISTDPPIIEADGERVLQVFENLIGNALKFTHRGGSIVIGSTSLERETLFWVKDDGMGIPAADLPHVFNRLWHAKKPNRKGTGLGLTICKAIVEAHGGRIWANSPAGEGTTMYFTIPTRNATSVVTGLTYRRRSSRPPR